jgi:hypothetical protein
MQHVVVSYIIPVARFHAPARHSSRLGQRFQLALGAATALAAISLSPGSAQAYVVTVRGVQYDVTTFTGTYSANTSKFALPANGGVMPWWGDVFLANDFATAVGENLGTPNSAYGSTLGPAFSYQVIPAVILFGRSWCTLSCFINPESSDWLLGDSVVYAQATLYTTPTAAPGPLPLLGAGATFGFSRQLRKRIKLAPAALGSALPQA